MLRLRRVRWWLLVWVWVIATVVPSVDVAEQTCEADGTCTVTERELSLSNTDTDTDTDTDTNTNDNKIDDALSCVDQEKACGHWADLGECDNNPRCTNVIAVVCVLLCCAVLCCVVLCFGCASQFLVLV